jgi:hypothetical protein
MRLEICASARKITTHHRARAFFGRCKRIYEADRTITESIRALDCTWNEIGTYDADKAVNSVIIVY